MKKIVSLPKGIVTGTLFSETLYYNESYFGSTQYDKMGNVETVVRFGLQDDSQYGPIDNLTYTYNGNQVVKVSDSAEGPDYAGAFHFVDGADETIEYEYDQNGNMTKDLNRGISSIQYNLLNLPSMIQYTDDNYQKYVYDALGNKLQTKHFAPLRAEDFDEPYPGDPLDGPLSHDMNSLMGVRVPGEPFNPEDPSIPGDSNEDIACDITTTDYCGNVIYHNGERMVLIPEGYVTFSGSTPIYHYYLKDHLGNVRVVVDENGSVEQVNHYYAFGGLMGESTGGDTQRFKYNGKELDRMNGLDWYDYGARHYDAMRFTTMDPMAEKYYSISPYAYCGNNPLIYVDPNGEEKIDALAPAKGNESHKNAVKNFNDEKNIINIWAHGSSEGIIVYDKNSGKNITIRDSKSFVSFLNENSKVWSNKSKGENVIIVLHSCETAKEDAKGISFAQNLSKNIDDATIIAPTENVYTYNGVEYGTFKPSLNAKMVNGEVRIPSGNAANWVQYENGKQTVTYRGDSHPGSKDYNIIFRDSSIIDRLVHFFSYYF